MPHQGTALPRPDMEVNRRERQQNQQTAVAECDTTDRHVKQTETVISLHLEFFLTPSVQQHSTCDAICSSNSSSLPPTEYTPPPRLNSPPTPSLPQHQCTHHPSPPLHLPFSPKTGCVTHESEQQQLLFQ